MATEPSGAVSTETTGDGTAGTSGAGSADDGKGKSASDEIRALRARAQEAEKLAAKLQKEQADREEAARIARGEHEGVIAELKAKLEKLEPEVEVYRAAQAARREALLSALPEEHRPIAAELPIDKLESYVGLHGKPGATPPAPAPRPAGAPGGAAAAGALTPQEIEAGIRTGGSAWVRDNAHRFGG